MLKILVVEDDTELNELFCSVLNENGYECISAKNGEEALEITDTQFIDLIITDIMMPKINGFELTKLLRDAGYDLPILMITAKSTMPDKQNGFLAGCDDYMVKPIDVNEMLWRVSALLRRSQNITSRKLKINNTTLYMDSYSVEYKKKTTLLPQKEFLLLYKLLFSIGRTFTKRQLIDEIWGLEFEGDPHTLEVHISRLRDKFKDNKDFEIITIRGLGYKAVER